MLVQMGANHTKGSFGYCLDQVCLTALALYLANRWFIKPSWIGRAGFFHDYFNDVLCIPLFLPPMLLAQRVLGLRTHDSLPTALDLLLHLGIWSVCFEVIAPRFPEIYRTTADPLDVAAYTLGAAVAGLAWGSWRRAAHPVSPSPAPPLSPAADRRCGACYSRAAPVA